MADLPINVSSAPVQLASQSASSNDAAPQDGQGFGDVLARQVADSTSSKASDDKPADTASKVGAPTLELADNTAAIVPDAAGTLPADMLAALLLQQNPNAIPAVVPTPLQSPATNPSKVESSDSVLNATLSALPLTAPAALAENSTLAELAQPALDTTRPAVTKQGQAVFTEIIKGATKNEVAASFSFDSTNKLSVAELAAAAQQTAFTAPAQTSTNNIAAATAAPSNPLTISTPLNQPGWSNELSQKITWLATQNNQSAELHLNPPQLGPLDVTIKISGDQATALFTSPHAAVRDAIELALPKLREMLADNGIMLGNATVSDQASRKGQDDSARAQQGNSNDSGRVAEVEAVGHQGGRVASISRHNGMVDTFA